jgi:hypothetical protein
MMDFPKPEVFGNYMLKDFGDIILPKSLSWWPIQPGWWVVITLILLFLFIYGYRRYRHWQRNAYRRDALGRMDALSNLTEMNNIIKKAAEKAFPSEKISYLWGQQWVDFLNSKTKNPCFSDDDGTLFVSLLTAPKNKWPANIDTLRDRVYLWLVQHQEAQL